MNNITIYGRLSKEPELRTYQNGEGTLCSFSVAVNRTYGEGTDFFDCTIFGKRAEVIEKYFHKGHRITLSGEMQCQPYEAKDGSKRYPYKIMVREFDFVETKKDAPAAQTDEDPRGAFEELEEVVPF